MSKRTKLIKFNIKDRGRKHVGQDRSDVIASSMVDAINSDFTQELVKTGDLYGYCGHEVRMIYGMNPPDTFVTQDGREIRIAPAIRTVELRAEKDGTIYHRQEFIENEPGEYAYQQYKAKIGGFSTAVEYDLLGNKRLVNAFYGFDYVRIPNYATNKGDGGFDAVMFDGLMGDCQNNLALKNALERSMVAQYDSIQEIMQSQSSLDFYQNELIKANQVVDELITRQKRIQARKKQKQLAMVDSHICPSEPFEKVLKEMKQFDSITIGDNDLQELETNKSSTKHDLDRKKRGQEIFNMLLGGFL